MDKRGGNTLKYAMLLLILFLSGCSTVAVQSEDGRVLSIKGSGHAKFENGAEIQGGTWVPPIPKIEFD
jgi:hypothetical protein